MYMYNMEGQFGYSIYAERGELGGITTRKEHEKKERIVTFLGVDSSHSIQRSGFFFLSLSSSIKTEGKRGISVM